MVEGPPARRFDATRIWRLRVAARHPVDEEEGVFGNDPHAVLELVAATEDDRDVLADLLEPLTNDGDDVATYLVATRAPSSAGVYRVRAGGEIEQQRGYFTSHLIQMLPPTMGDDRPLLYVTRL